MDDPDIVLGVDRDADGHAEQPLVGQRLRPQRIDLEDRRFHHRALRDRRVLQHRHADAERRDARGRHQPVNEVPPLLEFDHVSSLAVASILSWPLDGGTRHHSR